MREMYILGRTVFTISSSVATRTIAPGAWTFRSLQRWRAALNSSLLGSKSIFALGETSLLMAVRKFENVIFAIRTFNQVYKLGLE